MTTPRTIETDDDFETWRDDAEEPTYLVYSDGTPWLAYMTEEGDWYATRPATAEDRLEDGTYPGGVTDPLESLTRPLLIEQSAEMPPATPSAPAVSAVGAGPRTITTRAELDVLPDERVLLEASGRYRYIRGTFEQCWVRPVPSSITGTDERMWEVLTYGAEIPSSLVHSEDLDLPVTVLHDPSAPVPVVSDTAIEAATRALCGDPAVDEYYWRQRTREALTAALPHLTAAPSATREEVAQALMGFAEAFAFIPEHLADDLLARFAITPRTDR